MLIKVILIVTMTELSLCILSEISVGHKNAHIKDNSSNHSDEDYNDIYSLLFDDSQSLK